MQVNAPISYSSIQNVAWCIGEWDFNSAWFPLTKYGRTQRLTLSPLIQCLLSDSLINAHFMVKGRWIDRGGREAMNMASCPGMKRLNSSTIYLGYILQKYHLCERSNDSKITCCLVSWCIIQLTWFSHFVKALRRDGNYLPESVMWVMIQQQ